MKTVAKRPGDPRIYLYVMGEWYCYNPNDPPLGSGSMGVVYRGYRCSNGSWIAVKRVNDAFSNNKMIRERAKLEASLAFRHPNLVEMIGYCEEQPNFGPIFLLSKFVQGENIDSYVRHLAGMPDRIEKICNCMYMVLDALSYIHMRGVVHRDIKPSNIMIEQGCNARLMDLGIARMNGGNKFSHLGFIGTYEYSAPEQITREQNGSIVQINGSTDLYGLGITLYELLTGSNPMLQSSDADTAAAQLTKNLPPNPAIPKKLYKVILKATEKNQIHRFQTAEEFKQALREAMTPSSSGLGEITSWFEENTSVWISFSMILLVIVAVIITIVMI